MSDWDWDETEEGTDDPWAE